MVDLIEKRMEVSEAIADYKIEVGKNVYDKSREDEKLASVCELVNEDKNRAPVGEMFEKIMEVSRKRQYQRLREKELRIRELPLILHQL